jgi:hypothetical protein
MSDPGSGSLSRKIRNIGDAAARLPVNPKEPAPGFLVRDIVVDFSNALGELVAEVHRLSMRVDALESGGTTLGPRT